MKFRDFSNKHALVLIAIAVVFLALIPPVETHDEKVAIGQGRTVILSQQAKEHILYGDYKGGGHLYGAGKPCKSEFPKDWDKNKVITTVTQQAANDNIPWRQEDNGYHVSEKNHKNVRVRVVLDDDKSHIITAYPTNQSRNPCKVK
jgi:hypothetical protein